MISSEQLIQQIKAKISQIEGLRTKPFLVEFRMDELLALVGQLIEATPEQAHLVGDASLPVKQHYQTILTNLTQTKKKEGAALMFFDKTARRPRASQQAQQAYQQAFTDFIGRLRLNTALLGLK